MRQRVRLRRAGFRYGGGEDERLNDRDGRSLRDDRGRGGGIDEHGVERGRLIGVRFRFVAGSLGVLGVLRGVGGLAVLRILGGFRVAGTVSRRFGVRAVLGVCAVLGVLGVGIVFRRLGLGIALVAHVGRFRLIGAVGPFRALGSGRLRCRRRLGRGGRAVEQIGEWAARPWSPRSNRRGRWADGGGTAGRSGLRQRRGARRTSYMQSALSVCLQSTGQPWPKNYQLISMACGNEARGPFQRVPATIAGSKNLAGMAHCIAWPQSVPIVMALDPRI